MSAPPPIEEADIVGSFGATHHRDGPVIRLHAVGRLQGVAARQFRLWIIEVIVVQWPDELVVDLDAVVCLSNAGVDALVSGYLTAIEHGTFYRVVNAHHQVRRVLRATGTLDLLADSEDIGSLVLALLSLPAPR